MNIEEYEYHQNKYGYVVDDYNSIKHTEKMTEIFLNSFRTNAGPLKNSNIYISDIRSIRPISKKFIQKIKSKYNVNYISLNQSVPDTMRYNPKPFACKYFEDTLTEDVLLFCDYDIFVSDYINLIPIIDKIYNNEIQIAIDQNRSFTLTDDVIDLFPNNPEVKLNKDNHKFISCLFATKRSNHIMSQYLDMFLFLNNQITPNDSHRSFEEYSLNIITSINNLKIENFRNINNSYKFSKSFESYKNDFIDFFHYSSIEKLVIFLQENNQNSYIKRFLNDVQWNRIIKQFSISPNFPKYNILQNSLK